MQQGIACLNQSRGWGPCRWEFGQGDLLAERAPNKGQLQDCYSWASFYPTGACSGARALPGFLWHSDGSALLAITLCYVSCQHRSPAAPPPRLLQQACHVSQLLPIR